MNNSTVISDSKAKRQLKNLFPAIEPRLFNRLYPERDRKLCAVKRSIGTVEYFQECEMAVQKKTAIESKLQRQRDAESNLNQPC